MTATHLNHYTLGKRSKYVTDVRVTPFASAAMLDISQPAGPIEHPPVSDLLLTLQLTPFEAACDFGAGRFQLRPKQCALAGVMAPLDVSVDCHHRVRTLAIPSSQITKWEEQVDNLPLVGDFGRLHSKGFNNALIETITARLWDQTTLTLCPGRLFADAALITLWSELLREAGKAPVCIPVRGGLAAWQEKRCVAFLKEHLAEDVDLDTLASLVGLSPFHFSRAFKASTGLPPYRYQINLRIEQAKSLLSHTALPITSVALEVGYQSSQALGRAFKASVGMSPTEFRRQDGRQLMQADELQGSAAA